jgi:hypothetical protein
VHRTEGEEVKAAETAWVHLLPSPVLERIAGAGARRRLLISSTVSRIPNAKTRPRPQVEVVPEVGGARYASDEANYR